MTYYKLAVEGLLVNIPLLKLLLLVQVDLENQYHVDSITVVLSLMMIQLSAGVRVHMVLLGMVILLVILRLL